MTRPEIATDDQTGAEQRYHWRRDAAGPALLYLLVLIVLTWPTALSFFSQFILDGGDGLQNVWNIWWVKHAVSNLGSPWQTDYLYHPDGVTLIGQTLNPFNGFIAIPLSWILSQCAVVNTIVMFSFVATGVTTFWLARYVSPSYWAAILTGGLFTFSSYHFAHAYGHMQLISVEWLPLFLLCWLRLLDAPSARRAIAAGCVLFLVLLCDYYYLFYCVMAGFLLLVFRSVQQGSALHFCRPPRLWPMLCFVGVAAALCAPLLVGLLLANSADPFHGAHVPVDNSLDLLAPFIPGGAWAFGEWTEWFWEPNAGEAVVSPIESAAYLRYSLLLAFAAALYWRRRIAMTDRGAWLCVAGVFFALAMGPVATVCLQRYPSIPMPYSLLETLVPPLRVSGSPARMVVMVTLAVCLVAHSAWPLIWNQSGAAVRIGIGAILLFETWPYQLETTSTEMPTWVDALCAMPPGALAGEDGLPPSLHRQTRHNKPILLGYVSRLPDSLSERQATVNSLLEAGDFDALRQRYRVRYLKLHKFDPHRTQAGSPPGWKPVFLDKHFDLFVAEDDALEAVEVPERDCASTSKVQVRIQKDSDGRPVALHLRSLVDAARAYQIAFSLAASPAMPLPNDPRSVPLVPDALFEATRTKTSDLVSGHTGTLDSQGRATVHLHFTSQPAFVGRTIYFALSIKDDSAPSEICRLQGGQLRLPR